MIRVDVAEPQRSVLFTRLLQSPAFPPSWWQVCDRGWAGRVSKLQQGNAVQGTQGPDLRQQQEGECVDRLVEEMIREVFKTLGDCVDFDLL